MNIWKWLDNKFLPDSLTVSTLVQAHVHHRHRRQARRREDRRHLDLRGLRHPGRRVRVAEEREGLTERQWVRGC